MSKPAKVVSQELALVEPGPVVQLPPPVVVQRSPMELVAAAVEQGRDLATIEKLMDLAERLEKREAEKAYVAAITQFKQNPPQIVKDKRVLFQTSKGTTDYRHATLGAVCDAAIKGLAEVGITHRWDTEQRDDGFIYVTCVLTHALGHSERTTLRGRPDDSGSKNSIQAMGSTVTYLQRYTLLAASGLATHEQDDDGRGGASGNELITESQAADLAALIEEVGANQQNFLRFLRVESLSDLPANKYKAAVAALEAKRK